MPTTVLNVPDLSCEHCERTITHALTPVAGIRAVNVNIPGEAPLMAKDRVCGIQDDEATARHTAHYEGQQVELPVAEVTVDDTLILKPGVSTTQACSASLA